MVTGFLLHSVCAAEVHLCAVCFRGEAVAGRAGRH